MVVRHVYIVYLVPNEHAMKDKYPQEVASASWDGSPAPASALITESESQPTVKARAKATMGNRWLLIIHLILERDILDRPAVCHSCAILPLLAPPPPLHSTMLCLCLPHRVVLRLLPLPTCPASVPLSASVVCIHYTIKIIW